MRYTDFPRSRDEWLEPPDEDESETCQSCDESISEGFVMEGNTYCSIKCSPHSEEEYNELYEEDPDEYYWTEWE